MPKPCPTAARALDMLIKLCVRSTCGNLGAVLAAPVYRVQVVVPVGSMHAHHRLAACSLLILLV